MFHVEHEKITACPICGSENFKQRLDVKDHFYSKEAFKIDECCECAFLITNPRPNQKTIGAYYNSEDYISHNSQKKSLFSFVYRLARNLNFKTKYACLSRNGSGSRLLDYGAGEGSFVNYCQQKGVRALGYEPSKEARANAEKQGVRLLGSIPEQAFDTITLWHVLEHVHDLSSTLKRLVNALDQNGSLVIALPNPSSFDCKTYGKDWAAFDVPRHLWHFSENNIVQLLNNHGMVLEKKKPLKLDAFYISMLSEQYAQRSKLSGLITGLKSNLKAKKEGGYSSQIYIFKKRA